MRGLRCGASKACRAFCGGRRRKGSRSKEGGGGRPPFFVPPGLSGTCGRGLVAHKLARVWDLIPTCLITVKTTSHFPSSQPCCFRDSSQAFNKSQTRASLGSHPCGKPALNRTRHHAITFQTPQPEPPPGNRLPNASAGAARNQKSLMYVICCRPTE